MPILVISCSLNPSSRSRLLAKQAAATLGDDGQFIDLCDYDLPLCDGFEAKRSSDAVKLGSLIAEAEAVILATPIYCYDVSAACKNLIELTGRAAWTEKVVAFLCAAGGRNSYMSVMGVANSLMLDFRCVIVPRFVYASKDAFGDGAIADATIVERIDELCRATAALAGAIHGAAS